MTGAVQAAADVDGPALASASASASASVVICTYTQQRWDQLVAAVASVWAQDPLPREVVIVVDHDERLLERARLQMTSALVVPSHEAKGLSGARNTGVAFATSDVVVFLDDDAAAEPGWLQALLRPYENPTVLGVGGAIHPSWPSRRPGWFPAEFDWVVGCSYRGLPLGVSSPVRNLIGANMSFRRTLFAEVGGFSTSIGRTDSAPLGCEETELAIRVRQRWPESLLMHVPEASVLHHVPADRATLNYFVRRCFAEGLSKALVADSVGAAHATSSERTYVTRTLPRGLADRLLRWPARAAATSAVVMVMGLVVTTVAYGIGRIGFGPSALRLIRRTRRTPRSAVRPGGPKK